MLGKEAYADISGERLDLLDVDVLVWLVTASQRDEILANRLYRTLDVSTQGRDVFLVDEEDILYGAASSFQGCSACRSCSTSSCPGWPRPSTGTRRR